MLSCRFKSSRQTNQKLCVAFYFCLLPFALCLLTCSFVVATPINPQSAEPTEPAYLTPVEIRLSADGKKLYVVCEDGDSVLAVDTQTKQVVAKATVGHKPKGLAISPDGKTLYVSNEWSDTVTEVDAATFAVKRTLKTGWGPVGLVTDRSGKTLYVANSIADSVSLIDLASGAEIKRFVTHRYPEQMLLSRDGRRVYVSNILPHLGALRSAASFRIARARHGQASGGRTHFDSRHHRIAPHRRSAARGHGGCNDRSPIDAAAVRDRRYKPEISSSP